MSLIEDKHFVWRGKEVSRTENLSDIVFAMALTLIVASSVPSTFDDIVALWRDGIVIAVCFTMLLFLWYAHYLFFRRFDLEDNKTMLLNALLIFLIMSFVYPLKFLATFLVHFFTGYFASDQDINAVLSLEQAPWLTVIYSLGYAAVFLVFACMYHHAYKRKETIGLSAGEVVMTRYTCTAYGVHVVFGFAVSLLALTLPSKWNLLAGGLFVFIGIPMAMLRNKASRMVSELEERV